MANGLSDIKLKALLNNPPAERMELKDGIVDGLCPASVCGRMAVSR